MIIRLIERLYDAHIANIRIWAAARDGSRMGWIEIEEGLVRKIAAR